MIELGGNIELTGFSDLEGSELIILKKIIGNYARKFSDNLPDYEKLSLSLKSVHGNKYEVHANLYVKGKDFNALTTENNVFVTIADVLKKLESQIKK